MSLEVTSLGVQVHGGMVSLKKPAQRSTTAMPV
jgi:hypothetical protein